VCVCVCVPERLFVSLLALCESTPVYPIINGGVGPPALAKSSYIVNKEKAYRYCKTEIVGFLVLKNTPVGLRHCI